MEANISRLFCLLPLKISLSVSLSGCLLEKFWWWRVIWVIWVICGGVTVARGVEGGGVLGEDGPGGRRGPVGDWERWRSTRRPYGGTSPKKQKIKGALWRGRCMIWAWQSHETSHRNMSDLTRENDAPHSRDITHHTQET